MPSEGSGSSAENARWLLMFMVFSCFFILSCQRINMSIAILCMVNYTAARIQSDFCLNKTAEEEAEKEGGEFLWGSFVQTQILASYFYGLIPALLPAELVAERCNAKYVAMFGTIVSSVCNFVTPDAARYHYGLLIVVQMIKAMGHAFILPACSVMLGYWIPTNRLVRSMTCATSGIPLGSFMAVIISGFLCKHSDIYGWPVVFHISGGIGMLWCVVWFYLCCDSTYFHILTNSSGISRANFPNKKLPVPVKAILTSASFWGYVAGGVAYYWMLAMNIFLLPTYFRRVFKMDLQWNGILSSFPNVLQAFLYGFSFTVLRRKYGRKTSRRKTVACAGASIFSVSVVLLTFSKCSEAFGVLFMVIALGAAGCTNAAMTLIAVDMSPNFSGFLSGMMNTIGAIAGCGFPLAVGYSLSAESTMKHWENLFYGAAFVTFIAMILFMSNVSCEVQVWNNPENMEETYIESQEGRASRKRSTKNLELEPTVSTSTEVLIRRRPTLDIRESSL